MKITILQYAFRQIFCIKQKFSDVNFSISTASCLKQRKAKTMEKLHKRGNSTSSFAVQETTGSNLLLFEQIEPEFNEDETNDFDTVPEKRPALSTMQTHLKELNKRLTNTVELDNFCQQFDRLKMAIDLNIHAVDIEFKFDIDSSNMRISKCPEKIPSSQEERQQFIQEYRNPDPPFHNVVISEEESSKIDDELVADIMATINENYDTVEANITDSIDDSDSEENAITADETIEIEKLGNIKSELPNCKISYEIYSQNFGIYNIYIKNGLLVIYLSGKFMGKSGVLGYITKDNIYQCLTKVCHLAEFTFNIEEFIRKAHVFLCDVCIDIPLKDIKEVEKDIRALSSMLPLSSNSHECKKYGNHGILLKSRAKNIGSSFIAYSKWHDLILSANKGKRTPAYINEIGTSGKNIAKTTLRLECKMYKLEDIRTLLEAPHYYKKVMLSDVLNSTAKPILKRLEAFDCTESILKKRISLYVKGEEKGEQEGLKGVQVRERLAAERIGELVRDNNFDIRRVKDDLITEYNINDENTINGLIPYIKDNYWSFLLYRKPKAIKRVLCLLDKIHIYYGRKAGSQNA